jgi:hypothetical protein
MINNIVKTTFKIRKRTLTSNFERDVGKVIPCGGDQEICCLQNKEILQTVTCRKSPIVLFYSPQM